jgi:hypothetical protein
MFLAVQHFLDYFTLPLKHIIHLDYHSIGSFFSSFLSGRATSPTHRLSSPWSCAGLRPLESPSLHRSRRPFDHRSRSPALPLVPRSIPCPHKVLTSCEFVLHYPLERCHYRGLDLLAVWRHGIREPLCASIGCHFLLTWPPPPAWAHVIVVAWTSCRGSSVPWNKWRMTIMVSSASKFNPSTRCVSRGEVH